MRLAPILLVACGSSTPAPAPPTQSPSQHARETDPLPRPILDGLDAAQQCRATEARAIPCMDPLFAAYYRASTGFDMDPQLAAKKSTEAEARVIHTSNCLGDRDFAYMKNLVACWDEPTCDAFAACVGKRTKPID